LNGPEPDVLRWIERVTGGTVLGAERFTRGRETWWVDVGSADGQRRWMLKGRRVPAAVAARSRILTDFGPGREAAAIGALAGHGIPVPELGGYHAESGVVLMEQMPGSALLQRVDESGRRATVRDYAGHLARLHQLAPGDLTIRPAMPVPGDARTMALGGWLASAEADAATAAPRLRQAEPLHDLARWWLHANVPDGRGLEHVRLLHGDAGVNNFLFQDEAVTALIDWELALLGDPMSDLGNARYREALYPTGTYPDLIAEYERVSGAPVDRGAIAYNAAVSGLMLSLGMVANVQRPRPSQPEAVARLWQDALARVVVAEAIAEATGIELHPPAFDEPPASSYAPVAELLVARLDRTADVAQAGQDAAEARGYVELARAVEGLLSRGAALDAGTLADAATVLGRRPADVPSALNELAALVRADPQRHFERLLPVLAADARRRLVALAPLQAAEIWEDAQPVVDATVSPRSGPVLPSFDRPS